MECSRISKERPERLERGDYACECLLEEKVEHLSGKMQQLSAIQEAKARSQIQGQSGLGTKF